MNLDDEFLALLFVHSFCRKIFQVAKQRVDLLLSKWTSCRASKTRHGVCFLAAISQYIFHMLIIDSVVVWTDQWWTALTLRFRSMTHGAVCDVQFDSELADYTSDVARGTVFVSQDFRFRPFC